MSPRKLNRRSASLRNGSREIEIIFPFCEFSRLCEGDNFRLAVAATVGSSDRARGRLSSTIEPRRERPDRERREPRAAPSSLERDVRLAAERVRAISRFFSHFVLFQGFAGRKISHPVATPIPSSARPALGHGGNRRGLPPSRPRRALASPHARERAPSRGARRLDLNAVVVGHAP